MYLCVITVSNVLFSIRYRVGILMCVEPLTCWLRSILAIICIKYNTCASSSTFIINRLWLAVFRASMWWCECTEPWRKLSNDCYIILKCYIHDTLKPTMSSWSSGYGVGPEIKRYRVRFPQRWSYVKALGKLWIHTAFGHPVVMGIRWNGQLVLQLQEMRYILLREIRLWKSSNT